MRHSRVKVALIPICLIAFLLQYPLFSQSNNSSSGSDRDPFTPLISKGGLVLIPKEIDFTGLFLKGIIYSEGKSLAIINDEILKKGDVIGDYTILEIDTKKVILRKGNQGFTLNLEE